MDPFLSNFGNPWEMGTGFAQPQSFMPGTMNQPVMPQMDLPSMFANGLAAQGIRPQQFFQNPEAAMQSIMPSPEQPNVWDPTPVPGPPMMPGTRDVAGNPNVQTDDASGAQAGGASGDMQRAKQGTIADRLTAGLRGLQGPTAPPKPEMMQAARAPAPPDARGRVEAGELLKLLLAANAGPAMAPRALPPTLGAALQGIAR